MPANTSLTVPYREDLLKVEMQSGTIARSFINYAIGKSDNMENRFGVMLYRNGEPMNIDGASCEGFFMAPSGQNILITGASRTYAGGNVAWIQLPQACYNVEGQFALAIKVIGSGVTGTIRIIHGTVKNTGTDTPVAPTGTVPTYQEILAVYDQMVATISSAVRYDITQSLTTAEKDRARSNIEAAKDLGFYIDAQGYLCQRITGDN